MKSHIKTGVTIGFIALSGVFLNYQLKKDAERRAEVKRFESLLKEES